MGIGKVSVKRFRYSDSLKCMPVVKIVCQSTAVYNKLKSAKISIKGERLDIFRIILLGTQKTLFAIRVKVLGILQGSVVLGAMTKFV